MSSKSATKAKAAVVGATGLAGQQFLEALADHPTIEVTGLAASKRSAGQSYRDAITTDGGQVGWYADGEIPSAMSSLMVQEAEKLDPEAYDVIFTCIDAGPARELEPIYAEKCPVISTASAFRYEDDVPLIIPGVNHEHSELLAAQSKARGWKGWIAPNPNCTTVGLAVTLAPLHRAFGVKRVHMVSLQAVSGAGRSPGVRALDVVDNVVPFIPKEEGKVAKETQKVLGTFEGGKIVPADFGVSSTCTRIGVLEGHTEVVHVELAKSASESDIAAAWRELGAEVAGAGYPSAPAQFIQQHQDPYRPQVRLDRDAGQGMTTTVGRLRADDVVENGWKYVLVSHNTKMGAARGCILLGEILQRQGLIVGAA